MYKYWLLSLLHLYLTLNNVSLNLADVDDALFDLNIPLSSYLSSKPDSQYLSSLENLSIGELISILNNLELEHLLSQLPIKKQLKSAAQQPQSLESVNLSKLKLVPTLVRLDQLSDYPPLQLLTLNQASRTGHPKETSPHVNIDQRGSFGQADVVNDEQPEIPAYSDQQRPTGTHKSDYQSHPDPDTQSDLDLPTDTGNPRAVPAKHEPLVSLRIDRRAVGLGVGGYGANTAVNAFYKMLAKQRQRKQHYYGHKYGTGSDNQADNMVGGAAVNSLSDLRKMANGGRRNKMRFVGRKRALPESGVVMGR